ncbi:MAG TPA: glycosyl hydrolase family 8 [Candidatus Paceibacterota bacterium]|nr:glycosyl hydrolase family 8 [Candidatus Paceibacterota bacterium]
MLPNSTSSALAVNIYSFSDALTGAQMLATICAIIALVLVGIALVIASTYAARANSRSSMATLALRLIGYLLIIAGIILAFALVYRNSEESEVPLVYTPTQLLEATWLNYKNEYVEASTYRTVDTSRDNITTSEGQSYTMLRAVWMGDKQTFDGAWTWTKDNLQHGSDHLFSWEWGALPGGGYGVLTAQNGENSASDADTDIALSLVFAYARWQDPTYLSNARAIITDIWNQEVIEVQGTPYLTADNIEARSDNGWAAINPSYFNPAAYRIFAEIDPGHPWLSLVSSSDHLLQESMSETLGSGASDDLPPDWIEISKTTGAIQASPEIQNDTNFGFDTMRVPFELAIDYEWFNDPRDLSLLSQISYLSKEWNKNGTLASIYAHDGTPIQNAQAPSVYGGTIGYFMFADKSDASGVYDKKLLFLYNPGANAWKEPLSYYDDNWAWFGIALYNNDLPNLSAGLPPSAFSYSS